MKIKRIDTTVAVSIALLIVIFLFFTIMTHGRTLTYFNIKTILDQSIIFIVAGLGTIFVVAQGSADLSMGTTLGLAATVGAAAAVAAGSEWALIPVAIAIGLGQGFANGILVAKLKVPSFMLTLAILIGMRGFILWVQSITGNYYSLQGPLLALKNDGLKYSLVVALIVIVHIILAYTKFGEYCKAIGENESVAASVGIPVAKVKILAFVLSALMASIASFFMMAKVGGTNNTIGLNLEIDVLMCIFLGGVLVTGGYTTKIVKLLIGAFILAIIKNGMVIIGQSSVEAVQFAEGGLLITILIVVLAAKRLEEKLARTKTRGGEPEEGGAGIEEKVAHAE